MSAHEPAEAFATFERKWLLAHPEQAMVGLFVAPDARLRTVAFGTLVHELGIAAHRIHEPQVAAAKLAWWSEELERAAQGHARHPITQALFDEIARAADPHLWPALAIAALNQIESSSFASLDELLAQREPFCLAIADAE
ncbi:MAG: phytoene synthase, partial [Rudaea sp.]